MSVSRRLTYLLTALGFLSSFSLLNAHAILKASSPAENSSVAGPKVDVKLEFNSRIDVQRSKLTIMTPGKPPIDVAIDSSEKLATLAGHADGVPKGKHSLRWQVLAADGHISQGAIHFQVQ